MARLSLRLGSFFQPVDRPSVTTVMLTLKPFISRSLRRVGFDTRYDRHAVRTWEIEPACESERFAAIFDEGDLDRVTQPAPYTTLEQQVELLRPGRYHHPARHAHVCRDVLMIDGHLFTSRMVHALAHRPLPSIGRIASTEIDAGVLGTTEYGNRFFGHWFCDDVPMSRTARRLGTAYGHVNSDNRLIGHQIEYARLFDWNIRLVSDVRFRTLTILDWSPPTPWQRERFAELRAALPIPSEAPHKAGVMLLRQASGQRRTLDNEPEIAELARSRGFEVIDPMRSSVADLVAACANAKIVMGVEGSHLVHGFLPLAPGGTLLTLQPPFKFDHFWKARCDCIGARYAFIVGRQTAEAGFTIEVERVARMLDQLHS